MKKVICTLSQEELEEIRNLFEKKLALENLIKVIDGDNEKMYQKITKDYGETMRLFNAWWDNTRAKYQWPDGVYTVDFDESEIVSDLN